MVRTMIVLGVISGWFGPLQAQYISEVLEYTPAPGQYINETPWGTPASAQTLVGGLDGTLSLGAFGGTVVFSFEHPVENDPDNPFGVDFTIFGNAAGTWSEPGIVSVMADENQNGLPDDTWYELAGSDYFFYGTRHDYRVTYTNPHQEEAADVAWSDNDGGTDYLFANSFYRQPYYPRPADFPAVGEDSCTFTATCLAETLGYDPMGRRISPERAFGYADNRSGGSAPHTLPDNPYTPEKEHSGGDGFDIDWAVDEQGRYVTLEAIHFVRVQTGVLGADRALGELSTEIRGAVDVSPDASVTGRDELLVMRRLPDTIRGTRFPLEAAVFKKGRLQKDAGITFRTDLEEVRVENDTLFFHSPGEVTITAESGDDPRLTATGSAVLVYDSLTGAGEAQYPAARMQVYPNPATDRIYIKGPAEASLAIYTVTGKRIFQPGAVRGGTPVDVSSLPPGVYLLRAEWGEQVSTGRLVKQ